MSIYSYSKGYVAGDDSVVHIKRNYLKDVS